MKLHQKSSLGYRTFFCVVVFLLCLFSTIGAYADDVDDNIKDILIESVHQMEWVSCVKYQAKVIHSTIPAEDVYYYKINKGHRDGIRPGMIVLSSEGLLGDVKESLNEYSIVTPFARSTEKVSFMTEHQNEFELKREHVTYKSRSTGNTEILDGFICLEPVRDGLNEGEIVYTTGTYGVYPRGIKIGQILAPNSNDDGFVNELGLTVIQMAASIFQTDDVLVLDLTKIPTGSLQNTIESSPNPETNEQKVPVT